MKLIYEKIGPNRSHQKNAKMRHLSYKAITERYHKKKIQGRSCIVEDLVLRKNETSRNEHTWMLGQNGKAAIEEQKKDEMDHTFWKPCKVIDYQYLEYS